MSDNNKVALTIQNWGYGDNKPGDRVEVEAAEARMLINSGHATPANKTSAAAVDPTT